jgi:hypothetical protein
MSLAIIHFQPIEKYPPVLNTVDILSTTLDNIKVYLFTTEQYSSLDIYFASNANIEIVRYKGIRKQDSRIVRFWVYIKFYLSVTFKLFSLKPNKVLYYETISALPAIIYKSIQVNSRIFVHYHEYTTTHEYQVGMLLTKICHKLEKSFYSLFDWISHTNTVRLEMFVKDNPDIKYNKLKVLPNYPPKSWQISERLIASFPVRVVYIGALGLSTMYTKEFCEWVAGLNGEVEFDIYSYNFEDGVQDFLSNLNSPYIHLKRGINYSQIPEVLSNYHVGVILYKGHIPNYIHNAPNKLFEYLVCNLDVWFPHIMEGTLPFVTVNNYPKVLKLDFANLDEVDISFLINREGLNHKQLTCFAEDATALLLKALND